jgi:hypothetical protein
MNPEPSSKCQCKAQSAGKGVPLPRAATQQWRFDEAPEGQGSKHLSALLHAFAVALLQRQASALQLDACCLAGFMDSTCQEY